MVSVRHSWTLPSALLVTLLFVPVPLGAEAASPIVVIEEAVTDPQQDWDGSGAVTSSDEFVVLRNLGEVHLNVTGWRLVMEDSTPEEEVLAGVIAPGEAYLVVNPSGLLNNDVTLRLVDQNEFVVDEVVLDGTAAPDGNAEGVLDEAVHLSGPWAGSKGPATAGNGLPRFWTEAVWPANGTATVAPFQSAWLPATDSNLTMRLHVAPDAAPPNELQVGASSAPLVQQADGTWTAGPFAPAGTEVEVVLTATDMSVTEWPNGSALRFPVDPDPPRLEGDPTAVLNETRYLHWVPSFVDDHSGLATMMFFQEVDGEVGPVPECALPADGGGGAECALLPNVTRLIATATDVAGQARTVDLELVQDVSAPAMPSTFVFEKGVPPQFGWPPLDEPLRGLMVEVADDPGGTWNLTSFTLGSDVRTFTDHDWVPGAPRAYRLLATDRGGNTNATPWVVLPPEAVPVQVVANGLDKTLQTLLTNGTTEMTLQFDRPLEKAPRLILESFSPTLFRTSAEGTTAPDQQTAHYVLSPDGGLPRTGHGTWRLAGGEGTDGAPVDELLLPARWDEAPPRIEVAGWQEGWVAGAHQVVVVSAHDLGDPDPQLEVEVSERITVRQEGNVARLAVTGEGTHTFSATARDASGNEVEEAFVLRLDATAPILSLATAPEQWAPGAPLVVSVTDGQSGVDPDTLEATVRTAAGVSTPQPSWSGSRVELHTNTTIEGPFEIHIQVQDIAGNEAAGLLGERLSAAPLRMTVTVNGTRTATSENTTDDNGTTESGSHFAPTSGEPIRSWSDHTGIPPTDDPATEDATKDGKGDLGTVLAAFVGAGLLGLGTVVHRRRRGSAPPANTGGDADSRA